MDKKTLLKQRACLLLSIGQEAELMKSGSELAQELGYEDESSSEFEKLYAGLVNGGLVRIVGGDETRNRGLTIALTPTGYEQAKYLESPTYKKAWRWVTEHQILSGIIGTILAALLAYLGLG